MNNLAILLKIQRNYDEALPLLKQSLAIYEKVLGPVHSTTAHGLSNLAVILKAQSNYEEALPLFKRSLAIHEEVSGSDHPNTANCLSHLADLLTAQGNYAEARTMYERSLAIREMVLGTDHTDTSASLNNLARLLYVQGNFEEALPLYVRSLAIDEKVLGPDHPYTALSLNNLALLYRAQGNYAEARPLLERSLAIRQRVLGLDHPDTATSLLNLANLRYVQGNYEEARPLFEQSLAIRENALGSGHPGTAAGLHHLAILFSSQGNFEEARPLFERSLAVREKVLGPSHIDTAESLNGLAPLLKSQGNFEEALPLYRRSLAIAENVLGPDHSNTAVSLNNLAHLLKSQGNYGEALPLYERSLTIKENLLGPDHPDTARVLNNLGNLLEAQGRFEEARPLYEQAMTGSLSFLDRELPTLSEAGRLQLLQIKADPEHLLASLGRLPPSSLATFYSLFQNWKGKATRLQKASLQLNQASTNPEILSKKGKIQVLAKELSGLVLLPLANQESNHEDRIGELRRKRIRLERELNREFGLDLVMDTPSLEQARSNMPADSVLLDFFVGKLVYVWILAPEGKIRLVRLGEAKALSTAQDAFLRSRAIRGGKTLADKDADHRFDLLDKLWVPLRNAIGKASIVFVSPDGFLSELPFGVLEEENGSFLLEKHQFVYLSDPTSLANVRVSGRDVEGPLLAVGGVNYFARDEATDQPVDRISTRSRIGDSWNTLPSTRVELQSLRDLHDFILEWESPLTVIEGKAATEESIRAELPGNRYIHIATHGYFEPDHLPSLLLDAEEKHAKAKIGEQVQAVGLLPGLLSGLVFAGVNGEPDPSRDDGYLSAEEIQHLDLSGCDLVVLSACETALGSARAGEGLMSLRRAFSVAGADTVVSSLWKVDDVATAQLMKDFYTNLWQNGMGRGEALHAAKLRMLRRNRIANAGDARPSTWGAFVLSGDWN
ncbi:MAG: CHAT domain-containing protein [Planctomycetes bacterium]|nr:CHAT domain-containing protein [Planctomycetota bacterium]